MQEKAEELKNLQSLKTSDLVAEYPERNKPLQMTETSKLKTMVNGENPHKTFSLIFQKINGKKLISRRK